VTRIVLLMMMLFILVPAIIVSAAVKPENIIGLWFFDEGKGDTAVDSSGNKNDGIITSARWTDNGKYGKALLFEGAGGVKINSTEKLSLGDQFTMMAFFNAKTINASHVLICKNNEYLLRIDVLAEGGKMSAFVNLGGWEPRASAGVPVKDTWYHYAAVYSNKTQMLTVYIDGVNSGQSGRAGKPNPNNDPVNISNWNGGSLFLGIIDDVAIFNVALEETDVKNISDNGLKVALGGGKSVDSSDKLAATWGDVKYH
jgi:hypothetical protein